MTSLYRRAWRQREARLGRILKTRLTVSLTPSAAATIRTPCRLFWQRRLVVKQPALSRVLMRISNRQRRASTRSASSPTCRVSQTQGGILASVVDALKGGATSQTGNTTTAEQNQQAGTSTQTGTQTGSSATQDSSLQTQNLMTAIQQLLQGTTHTVGTEQDKTKGSEMGGGLSLGL
jgi:exonuclease VII large subunit